MVWASIVAFHTLVWGGIGAVVGHVVGVIQMVETGRQRREWRHNAHVGRYHPRAVCAGGG